jgi:hypothetical protein
MSLRDDAIAVLRANDRGRYTVPTASGLYPAQWNWDSCLVALGFAVFDRPRAWLEIESLFEGQWPDGMVPSILFREDDASYFPNRHVWRAGAAVPSSGITQPPVAATVVRRLADQAGEQEAAAHLRGLLPRLLAWHRWFYRARDPKGSGLVAIIHPWESGMDNSPLWDAALATVEPGPSTLRLRRDIAFSGAAARPTGAEYDRYINLVLGFRDLDYDPAHLYDRSPLLIADAGFNAMLQRANLDLLDLARRFGTAEQAREVEAMARRTAEALEHSWSPEAGLYRSYDLRQGLDIVQPGIGALLPLYAADDVAKRRPGLVDRLGQWLSQVRFGVPSFAPDAAQFEPQRYWRGPVWLVVNWMLAQGLTANGQGAMAERIRRDSLALLEGGFGEYFDPLTGAVLGGRDFSWTAAMALVFSE